MARALYRARKLGPERAASLDRDMTDLGLGEGIRFVLDRIERTPNTRRAHLLIAYASRRGLGPAAAEALFTAYFEEAHDIGSTQVLADIAERIGLDPSAAAAALDDADLRASVVDIEEEASRLGISGVPFFIIIEGWAVSEAQSVETWLDILQRLPTSRLEVPAE